MSRVWKEPYSVHRAEEIAIHGVEDSVWLGDDDTHWIYFVYVCSFTFAFYSLDMIRQYLVYYETKILPSRAGPSIWVGEPQTTFNRLPLRLRAEGKRQQVIKALTKALKEFGKEESKGANAPA